MHLRKATRQKAKIRLGLSAPSGGGKTFSALKIAYGITGDWSKIAVIDSENGSADLYSHLGAYNVISLTPPFSPERYIQAIKACEDASIEVAIIDSITHEWEGDGGILQLADQLGGQYQSAWKSLTPRHEKFKQSILQSKMHIITTVRRKTDYDMVKGSDGKTKVVKVGMKEVTREGWEYELTVNLEMDQNHNANASKDRTGLFMGKPSFVPSEETGVTIKKWCDSGAEPLPDIDPRPVLNQEHPKWNDVVKAMKGGYTLQQVQSKYKVFPEVEALLEELLAEVAKDTKTVLPASNGQQKATSDEPF